MKVATSLICTESHIAAFDEHHFEILSAQTGHSIICGTTDVYIDCWHYNEKSQLVGGITWGNDNEQFLVFDSATGELVRSSKLSGEPIGIKICDDRSIRIHFKDRILTVNEFDNKTVMKTPGMPIVDLGTHLLLLSGDGYVEPWSPKKRRLRRIRCGDIIRATGSYQIAAAGQFRGDILVIDLDSGESTSVRPPEGKQAICLGFSDYGLAALCSDGRESAFCRYSSSGGSYHLISETEVPMTPPVAAYCAVRDCFITGHFATIGRDGVGTLPGRGR